MISAPLFEERDEEALIQWLRSYNWWPSADIFKEPLGSHLIRHLSEESDPTTLILKAHLFFERFLDEIIRVKFRRSDALFSRHRLSFTLKVDILLSRNYLNDSLYSDLVELNGMRNKVAHDLFFDISAHDMSRFAYCEGLRELRLSGAEVRRLAGVYLFKQIMFNLLIRLTQRHPFIATMKVHNP